MHRILTKDICFGLRIPAYFVVKNPQISTCTGANNAMPKTETCEPVLKALLSFFVGRHGGFQDFSLQQSVMLVISHTYIMENRRFTEMFVDLGQIPSGDLPLPEQSTTVMNPETSRLHLVVSNPLCSTENLCCNSHRPMKVNLF